MSEPGTDASLRTAATLGDGAEIEVLSFDGALLHFVGERAHPPGRPLDVRVTLAGVELALQGKAAGSRLREDGRFDVRLRLHSLRRAARALLEEHFR